MPGPRREPPCRANQTREGGTIKERSARIGPWQWLHNAAPPAQAFRLWRSPLTVPPMRTTKQIPLFGGPSGPPTEPHRRPADRPQYTRPASPQHPTRGCPHSTPIRNPKSPPSLRPLNPSRSPLHPSSLSPPLPHPLKPDLAQQLDPLRIPVAGLDRLDQEGLRLPKLQNDLFRRVPSLRYNLNSLSGPVFA